MWQLWHASTFSSSPCENILPRWHSHGQCELGALLVSWLCIWSLMTGAGVTCPAALSCLLSPCLLRDQVDILGILLLFMVLRIELRACNSRQESFRLNKYPGISPGHPDKSLYSCTPVSPCAVGHLHLSTLPCHLVLTVDTCACPPS